MTPGADAAHAYSARVPPAVLHVSQPTDYGVGRYVAALARDQHDRGWRVGVASPDEGPLPDSIGVSGADHLPWTATRAPGPRLPAEVLGLRRAVRRFRPDVVHLHSSKAGLAGRIGPRLARPLIFQPHAWSFLAVDGPVRRAAIAWERLAALRTDVVVCGSDGERTTGEEAGLRARWRVVPNFVDLDRFAARDDDDREQAKRRLGLEPAPTVVCVGRLCHQKGQDLLLQAWPEVVASVPAARLVLVGDGPDRAELEADLPVSARLVGTRDDVADWLTAADVVAQPSRYETLSLSLLEAMASARSVVATAHQGAPEALGGTAGAPGDTEAGALVALEDADGLAAALVRRLASPELAATEGAAGRVRAERSYGRAAWGDAMAKITLDALEVAS